MMRFFDRYLFSLSLAFSVFLHASVVVVLILIGIVAAVLAVEPPKLKSVQRGRASISLRSSVAAGPKPSQAVASIAPPAPEKPRPKSAERKEETPKPKTDAPAAPAPKKLDKPQEQTKPAPMDKPPPKQQTAKQEVKPAPSPAKEEPKIVAEQTSLPSRGSAGSRGAEVDGPAQPYASNPAPLYPPEALQAGIEGTVEVFIKIDARGRVTSVRIHKSSGVESLDQSALDTVRQWEFEPATRRGVPVPYEVRAPIVFEIKRRR